MISRRFFFPWTERFTRGIVDSPYWPSMRLTVVASGPTSFMPVTRRRRLPVFLVSMCFPVALRCSTLPFRVIRNRLAAPRCDFIFGMTSPTLVRRLGPGLGLHVLGGRLRLALSALDGRHHHGHVAPVELRIGL